MAKEAPAVLPENTFTLDDLTRATKRRLGPTKFIIGEDDEVELPSIYRLNQKTRQKVWDQIKQMNDLGEDEYENEEEGYELLVEAISETLLEITPGAKVIVDAVQEAADGDTLIASNLLGEILARWMENTRAGEA
jgi:acetoin utilization deacetylase AcuC-like enzyme